MPGSEILHHTVEEGHCNCTRVLEEPAACPGALIKLTDCYLVERLLRDSDAVHSSPLCHCPPLSCGVPDPYHSITDPDPALLFSGYQDANKKLIFSLFLFASTYIYIRLQNDNKL
jgi:hypothetical protein